MATRSVILAVIIGLCVVSVTTLQPKMPDPESPEFDEKCVVNPDLDPAEEDNYVLDCMTDKAIEENMTQCCQVGDEPIGCCDPSKSLKSIDGVKDLLITIGTVTGSLMVFIFLCTWCNPKSMPCLGVFFNKVQQAWYGVEECCCCCQDRVAERNYANRLKDVPQFDVPSHVKETVQDDFWGVPMA